MKLMFGMRTCSEALARNYTKNIPGLNLLNDISKIIKNKIGSLRLALWMQIIYVDAFHV